MDRLHSELSQTEEMIRIIEGNTAELRAHMEATPVVASPAATGGGVVGGVDPTLVRELEDTISALQKEKAAFINQVKSLEADKSSLTTLLENIRNERRTDVMARMEDEIEALHEEVASHLENIAALKTDRTKNATKLAELKERAEAAEAELKERDEAEQRALSKEEETALLKSQVTKQREEIVMKKKAATAGWDAAAEADEKLDTQVEKAYKKGLSEGKKIATSDTQALHDGIEAKERRIVELLEKSAMAERLSQDALEQRDAALQQAAEAVAALSEARTQAAAKEVQGSGGRGGGGQMRSDEADAAMEELEYAADKAKEELEEARESLNEAQEEVVSLSEELERLQEELHVTHKKMAILEKIAASSGAGAAASVPVSSTSSYADASDGNVLDELIAQVRDAIEKVQPEASVSLCTSTHVSLSLVMYYYMSSF